MSISIDTIIKQAMMEVGVDPAPRKEIEKISSENKLANSLYELAGQLECFGDIPIGVHKSASSEKSSLRELTKAYLFQQMLKSAVEERLGISDAREFEKTASGACLKSQYLAAFGRIVGREGRHANI